uniref:Uncharacterized protein n=1 Tax=Bionectria ochroleuca TaxID=29856 RepID=A0A0B7JTY4_BIOOC
MVAYNSRGQYESRNRIPQISLAQAAIITSSYITTVGCVQFGGRGEKCSINQTIVGASMTRRVANIEDPQCSRANLSCKISCRVKLCNTNYLAQGQTACPRYESPNLIVLPFTDPEVKN